MLERASSCLEPAAQTLFRSIEAPARSQRRLPPAFWRHTRLAQDQAGWWPEYLNHLRRAGKVRERDNHGSNSVHRDGFAARPFAPQRKLGEIASSSSRHINPLNRRGISKVVRQARKKEDQEFEEALELNVDEKPPVEVELLAPESIPEPRRSRVDLTPGEQLEELLRAGGEPDYIAVWQSFISLNEPRRFSRAVLRYLSRSTSPDLLRRGLRIFETIEVEDRTRLTYESAVRVAVGLRKYEIANNFVLEALERKLGAECSQFLMGHFIEKESWKSARKLLEIFVENTPSNVLDRISANPHISQKAFEAPIWKNVDEMISLPRKIMNLSGRLKSNDAVLALDRADIEHLATRLLERALSSTTIMAVISPEGILALFDRFRELRLLRISHYLDALHALRLLRDTRNRSQLALLIFRNMKHVFPNLRLYNSTYGTMISILSAAPNKPEAFEYILQAVTHHKDSAMYQRIMSACAEQGYTTYVEELLERLLHTHGPQRDLVFYTPVLVSFAKQGDVKGAQRFFDDLSTKYGLEPSQQCWNILFLAHARAEDFEGAAALFRKMVSCGVAPDSYTFGTLMSMFSNAGDTQAVLQLVDLARKQKIPATTPMIDTIVHAYCLNEEVKEAEVLVETATQMRLPGTPTRMWNILLRHYAFRANSAAVLRIQERMRELAVKPDAMTYASLMTSLVIIGKATDAAAILRSLHLAQVTTANRFHYSIVFHGYVQEGQRDQAMVIYSEMLERFGKPSPSAHLAMLHLQSQRDNFEAQSEGLKLAANWTGRTPKSVSVLQSHSIEYLADALVEMADDESISDEPQPGFGRRKPSTVGTGVFLEAAIAALNLSNSYEKAQELLSRYEAAIEASHVSKLQKSLQTVQLRTAHLRGMIKSMEGSGKSTARFQDQSRDQIDAIWNKIFAQTLSNARERDLTSFDLDLKRPTPEAVNFEESATEAEKEHWKDSSVESMAEKTNEAGGCVTEKTDKIIPAQQFALSVPLSAYMRGLAFQQRLLELEGLLNRLQTLGFKMTSKNWNTYIQILSDDNDSVLRAFRIFEERFLPNTPPWELIKRGKVFDESQPADLDQPEGKATIPRTKLEKKDPGHLVPTYFTLIHLAAAFIKSYGSHVNESEEGKISLFNELRMQAPGTVKFIQAMPLLKDRVQGVLLRGRAVKGDLIKMGRGRRVVDRAGLLGSRSQPEDNLATTELQQQSEIQDSSLRMIATDKDGDPYVEGLPVGETPRLVSWRPSIMQASPDRVALVPPEKSPARIRFEESIEKLREVAHQPERRVPDSSIKGTRRRGDDPPIRPYMTNPSGEPLKPMGAYEHKDTVFTKPMITMSIPRRRELGSERRAFDIPKHALQLQQERARSARAAQVRAKKMRQSSDTDPARAPKTAKQSKSEEQDENAFLEARLVRAGSGPDASQQSQPQPESQPHPPTRTNVDVQIDRAARTSHNDTLAEQQTDPNAASHDRAESRDVETESFTPMSGRASSKNSTSTWKPMPREGIWESKPGQEDSLLPWAPVEQFDESDFVTPHAREKEGGVNGQ